MKKVLILAYNFSPYNSIGAQRPVGWYKYFKKNGIHPIVITRHWDTIDTVTDCLKSSKEQTISREETELGTIIRVPYKANLRDLLIIKHGLNKYKLLRKALTFLLTYFQYLTSFYDNKKQIYKEANKFLLKEKVDFIIATGEPFVLFKYANKLSKKHNIRWIADYRDGWSTNNRYQNDKGMFNKMGLKFIRSQEKRIVNSANCITVTSSSDQKELALLFAKMDIHVIYNGYFKEFFNKIDENKLKNNVLKIVYSGTIYPFQRLDVFLDGFQKFIESNRSAKIELIFYQSELLPESKNRIEKYSSIRKNIKIESKLPHKQLIEALVGADLLLLLANEKLDQLYAKTFEYIAARRLIMMVVNDNGSLEKLLTETSSGVICNTKEEVFLKLKSLYKEWEQNDRINCDTKNIDQFTREYQTEILSKLIIDKL